MKTKRRLAMPMVVHQLVAMDVGEIRTLDTSYVRQVRSIAAAQAPMAFLVKDFLSDQDGRIYVGVKRTA